METWPAELQDKLNTDNFSVKFGRTIVESDTDTGLSKRRSRYTSGVDIYTSSINVDIDDFDIVMDFYKTNLNNGVDYFTFVNPLTAVLDTWRFKEEPDTRPLGGRMFRVSMTWERIP